MTEIVRYDNARRPCPNGWVCIPALCPTGAILLPDTEDVTEAYGTSTEAISGAGWACGQEYVKTHGKPEIWTTSWDGQVVGPGVHDPVDPAK